MQIHLLDISSCDGKTIQESVVPELEKIDFQMGSFPVLAKEPVELTITNTGDKVLELTAVNNNGTIDVSFTKNASPFKITVAGGKTVEVPANSDGKVSIAL